MIDVMIDVMIECIQEVMQLPIDITEAQRHDYRCAAIAQRGWPAHSDSMDRSMIGKVSPRAWASGASFQKSILRFLPMPYIQDHYLDPPSNPNPNTNTSISTLMLNLLLVERSEIRLWRNLLF
jgi:hypothetical protein